MTKSIFSILIFSFQIGFLAVSKVAAAAQPVTVLSQVNSVMPNLSLIKAATLAELMQELSKPGNKIYWLCGQDIVKKIQNSSSQKKLSPECRSELNRILTHDSKSDNEEVMALAVQITKGLSYNQEKLEAIYKWVTTNIQFDVLTYTELIKDKKIFENPVQLISPLKTLSTKTAVAEGYALLTAALLRASNIPAVTIVGVALKGSTIQGPHAWNEAFINDRWVNLDTTWDAGTVTGNFEDGLVFNPHPTTQFFDLPDAEFKKTHQAVLDIR